MKAGMSEFSSMIQRHAQIVALASAALESAMSAPIQHGSDESVITGPENILSADSGLRHEYPSTRPGQLRPKQEWVPRRPANFSFDWPIHLHTSGLQ